MKLFLIILLLSLSARLAQASGDVSFHGFLVTPPTCVISNDETIEVSFGNVQIDEVDGTNYMQDIPYTIDCDSELRSDLFTMTLTLNGAVADFDETALATNIPNLGIAILQDGQPFEIGTAMVINEQSKPALKAVPVKKSGVELSEGSLDSWATLQVDYQ